MKSLIISIVLLSLVIGGLIGNAIYIESLTEELIGLTQSLPASPDEDFDRDEVYASILKLHKCFYNNEHLVAITLGYGELERMKSSIISLKCAFNGGLMADFFTAKERLLSYLHRLEGNELISFDNII